MKTKTLRLDKPEDLRVFVFLQFLEAAVKFGVAARAYWRAQADQHKVHGLDEFDPVFNAWESRIFHAEEHMREALDILKYRAELWTRPARYRGWVNPGARLIHGRGNKVYDIKDKEPK